MPRVMKNQRAPDAVRSFRVSDWPMHHLLAIGRYHVRNVGLVLSPFDCPAPKWRLLSILNEEDGRSISYLAEIGVIERTNLGRLIDNMVEEGLVTRDAHAKDKRQTMIFLTSAGRDLFERSLPAVLKYYGRFLSGVSAQELSMLMTILAKIENNICPPQARLLGW